MRYFNVKQHMEPRSMFYGDRLVNIQELELTGTELTEEQAGQKPNWGSGNIAVDEKGKWNWMACNHDTSG